MMMVYPEASRLEITWASMLAGYIAEVSGSVLCARVILIILYLLSFCIPTAYTLPMTIASRHADK